MSLKLPRLKTFSEGSACDRRETFRASRTIGFLTALKDWGTIAKCPHCERTGIERNAKNQITCGSYACRQKQNNLTAREKRAVRVSQVETGGK